MIIKCKMCGGDIQFNPGDTCGQCDHCGCKTTFPKLPDEQRANLFNRANHFRRQCEFDKAMTAYEHILEVDDTDAEAHWGIVLSKFGIEYVEDPVTHERIPTCHRAQVISILSDEDYQNAIKCAPDTQSREIYEQEAKRIAEIQKGILAISSQEKPFDVFICYKETDDNGSRTKDSALAQEIYYQLTNEGYKVFFSRITLEDKLGQEYEPYIFAALNSAKVMLVVGTKPENFSAVWVKNEWNRFLAIMKNDRNRVLIPCYRDMDPYDLPEELSSLQSQDMSKIGFMQDIIHGVKKVLGSDKQNAPNVTVQSAGPGVMSLHKRAVLFLEDSDWDSATEYFDRILDIDPEYAPAYIGKVQVKNKVRRETDLARCREPISTDPDFQKALRFADEKQKAIYNGYNRTIVERIDLERKETTYREAIALENRAAVENEFLAAAQKFDAAGEIRDAKERAANCRAKAASAKAEAEKVAIVYREQMEREKKERARQEEERRLAEEKRKKEEAERLRREEELRREKKKQIIKICFVIAAIAVLITGGYFVYEKVIHPKMKYDQAQALLNDGKLDEAYAAFNDMLDYGDSATKLLEIKYKKAEGFLSEGKLTEAKQYYGLASGYLDAEQQINNIDAYVAAEADYKSNNLVTAGKKYKALGNFLDSAAKFESVSATLYTQATKALEEKDYEQAYGLLIVLGDYYDCATLIENVDKEYDAAIKHWTNGDKLQAEQDLQVLVGWKDADTQLTSLRLEIADDAAANEDYDSALAYYGKVPGTEEIKNKIAAAKRGKAYQEAVVALGAGKLEEAYQKFIAASGHKDADQQAARLEKYQQANELTAFGKYEDARSLYIELGEYLNSSTNLAACNEALYQEASDLYNNGKKAQAYKLFTLISGYSDSGEIVSGMDSDYLTAIEHIEKGEKLEAEKILVNLAGWKDVDDRLDKLREEIADNAVQTDDFDTAIAYYNKLSNKTEEVEAKLAKAIQGKNYSEAIAALESGDLESAYAKFTTIGEYKDAVDQASKLSAYQKANATMAEGKYQEAREEYIQLGTYLESSKNLESCNAALYQEATDLKKNGDYAKAYEMFVLISGYSDSAEIAKKIKDDYQAADELLKNGKYDEANAAFVALYNYSDSSTKAQESIYQKSESLKNAGSFDEAVTVYSGLGEYKDSKDKINVCLYSKAESQIKNNDTDGAIETFESIPDYNDSLERAKALRYAKAKALWDGGDLQAAREEYEALANYSDAPQMLTKVLTEIADNSMANKDYASALSAYQGLKQTTEIKEREYKLAQICYDEEHYEQATLAYETLGQYELSLSKLLVARYAWADQLFKAGEYAKAAEQFALLGDMTDSATRANESIYQLASEKMTAKNYDDAKKLYNSIADYKDAGTLVKECDYRKAMDYLSEGKNKEAETIFKSLGEYSDSKTKAEECVYNQAEILFTTGKYAEAKVLYDTISYSDSKTKSKQCVYNQAEALFIAGKYAEAKPLYDSITYSDSQTKSKQCVYNQAEALFAAKKYADASKMYDSIDYLDSKDKAQLSTYQRAETYYSGYKYAEAEEAFLSLKDYSDSSDRAKDCHLQQGIVLLEAEDYRGALEFFETVDYENSATLAAKCHYELGRISHLAGKIDDAIAEYAYAVSLPEAYNALLSAAKDYAVINESEKALQTLWLIRNQKDAQDELLKIATTATQSGKTDLAILTYSAFEDNPGINFSELYQRTSYESIKALLGNCSLFTEDLKFKEYLMYHFAAMARDYGLYDVAIQAYSEIKEYSDTTAQLNDTYYLKASAKEIDGDQEGAYEIFISLGEYRNSFERANKPYYDLGTKKKDAGEWDAAVTAFEHAGTYSDAPIQILATRYAEGEAKREATDWDGAIKAFMEAGTYGDATTQILATRYAEGKKYLEQGLWDKAQRAFEQADQYSDASTMVLKSIYLKGNEMLLNGKYKEAIELFASVEKYSDATTKLQEAYYMQGMQLYGRKKYKEAVDSFSKARNYSDSNKKIEEIRQVAHDAKVAMFSTKGMTVHFGSVEQNHDISDGKEAIQWTVLDVGRDKALLISKYGLEIVVFQKLKAGETTSWSECSLRSYTNGNFYREAFTSQEKSAILDTKHDGVSDKVFILSKEEVQKYFPQASSRKLRATAHARTDFWTGYGSRDYPDKDVLWWTRSMYKNRMVCTVNDDGEFWNSSTDNSPEYLRPALWIDLKSQYFWVIEE